MCSTYNSNQDWLHRQAGLSLWPCGLEFLGKHPSTTFEYIQSIKTANFLQRTASIMAHHGIVLLGAINLKEQLTFHLEHNGQQAYFGSHRRWLLTCCSVAADLYIASDWMNALVLKVFVEEVNDGWWPLRPYCTGDLGKGFSIKIRLASTLQMELVPRTKF